MECVHAGSGDAGGVLAARAGASGEAGADGCGLADEAPVVGVVCAHAGAAVRRHGAYPGAHRADHQRLPGGDSGLLSQEQVQGVRVQTQPALHPPRPHLQLLLLHLQVPHPRSLTHLLS